MTLHSLLLDSEGLSKAVASDRGVLALIEQARQDDIDVVVSSVTLVEARNPRVPQARFDWTVSRLTVLPVSEAHGRRASGLLSAAGLHGHKYAIDAVVCATALEIPGPVAVLTSDPTDLTVLLGELGNRRVRVIPV